MSAHTPGPWAIVEDEGGAVSIHTATLRVCTIGYAGLFPAAEGTALADTPHDGTCDEILLHLRDAVSYIEADCTQRGVPFCFNGARLALNSALLKRETS